MLDCSRPQPPTGLRRSATLFVIGALTAVSMLLSGVTATAASHPSSFAWTGTTVRSSGAGWELVSPSGVYKVLFQADHNLVVYHGSRAIWASNTNGVTLDSLVLTAGNFASGLKGNVSASVWCSTPCSFPGGTKQWNNGVNNSASAHHLNMQNDGNFVEYTGSSGGTALWASNTVGK